MPLGDTVDTPKNTGYFQPLPEGIYKHLGGLGRNLQPFDFKSACYHAAQEGQIFKTVRGAGTPRPNREGPGQVKPTKTLWK